MKIVIEKDDLYCQECKQIAVLDPYNPNYLICGCSNIGQVEFGIGRTPLSWVSVKTKSYISEPSAGCNCAEILARSDNIDPTQPFGGSALLMGIRGCDEIL